MEKYIYEQVKENKYLPVHFDVAYESYHSVPFHWHKDLEILCMLKGEMTAIIQAEEYIVHAGDVLIINSEDIHMTKIFGTETSYILLQISAARMKEFFPEFHKLKFKNHIAGGGTLIQERTGRNKKEICSEPIIRNKRMRSVEMESCKSALPCELLNEMFEIYYGQKKGYFLLFTAKLYELLYCLYCDYSEWPEKEKRMDSEKFFSVKMILEWIQQHYSEPVELAEAASRMGFSKEHFCRIFRQYTGMTFLEYVNELRVIKLYEDMQKSEESVSNLMKKHGISNYKIFLRVFKKLYGDTPQNVRKHIVEEGNT